MPASRDSDSAFSLVGVTRAWGEVRAVDDVSLDFDRGRTTVLIGSSGSGKSTVLRLLIALEWPDAGEVFFDGEPLRRAQVLEVRRRVGYVIQEGGLFPHLTAADNVALVARVLGWPAAKIEERSRELARLCALPDGMLQRYPAELSGGQRQRFGLVRALMLDPPVLLLDEPLGALDPVIRHELQAQMRELFATLGKTVVLVTHDVAEAAWLADPLVLLRAGRIVQQGSARELVEAPADPFVTRFMTAQRSLDDAL